MMKNKQSKSRPIIFNSEMVNTILDGRKTQTRRVIKPQPIPVCCENYTSNCFDEPPECCGIPDIEPVKYPYGKIGDQLWVRETWCPVDDTEYNEDRWIDYKATPKYSPEHPAGWDNDPKNPEALKWKSPIYMPRSASRITLEITDIKVERLQSISRKDAAAEGIPHNIWRANGQIYGIDKPVTEGFAGVWNSIYKNHPVKSWKVNPFVWVISFRMVKDD